MQQSSGYLLSLLLNSPLEYNKHFVVYLQESYEEAAALMKSNVFIAENRSLVFNYWAEVKHFFNL